MNLKEVKKELVKRYKYLYENAPFILAPYMYEQSKEEFTKQKEEYLKQFGQPILKKPMIFLNIYRLDDINKLFEEFLLSDKPMEESSLYKFIESKRNDKDYLNKVKTGLALLEKENKDIEDERFKTKLSIREILGKVSDYIEEQSGDLDNKKRKMCVLDEYYRILRYKNNGKIYISGRNLNLHDVDSIVMPISKIAPSRKKHDIGITKNPFITTITSALRHEDNYSIFTEAEKQQIYLEYHDELPCDLEIACNLEKEYVQLLIDTRLSRPKTTSPCGEIFLVKEEEIFVNPNDKLYRYYQLCPHCGYIVNIPKEILSDGIKQRIEDRCSKDNYLFRKMYLYSELFSLDKKSTQGQKRVLKK